MKLTEDQNIAKLRRLLGDFEGHLPGQNYELKLSAMLVKTATFDAAKVLKFAYAGADPKANEFVKSSFAAMSQDLEKCLLYAGDDDGHFPDAQGLAWAKDNVTTLTKMIRSLAHGPMVMKYTGEKGLPGISVFWNFAFLIFDPDKGHTLILTGKSSD